MSSKIQFDVRNFTDNVSDFKTFHVDTSELNGAMLALQKSFPHLNTPDFVAINRWEDYRKQAKREFLQGFDDGYFGGLPTKPKMTEAYSEGYSDGYALAQMHDAHSYREENYNDN